MKTADIIKQAKTEERQKCWDEINALIIAGSLPGNGLDKTAERNGLIMACNTITPDWSSTVIKKDHGK